MILGRFRQVQGRKPFLGFTLLELIIATAILLILSTMAVPMARLTIKREKERRLRADLWEMRDAIDRYKMDADRNAFQTKVDSQGYPPDLETLVKGEDVQGKESSVSSQDSDRSHDGHGGVGPPFDAGRSGFRLLGRAERVRRLHQVAGRGAGRDQV